jgi:hypothetical protein
VTGLYQGLITGLQVEQWQGQAGGVCTVTFDVQYRARL